MYILSLNCGSSSIKAEVLEPHTRRRLHALHLQRWGTPQTVLTLDGSDAEIAADLSDKAAVLEASLRAFLSRLPATTRLDGVGHRVVHGGERFTTPTLIDETALAAIRGLEELAPLHQPMNRIGIEVAQGILPELPHIAVFDTAFHATLPRRARTYALPADVRETFGIRRYGFHGISHAYVAKRAAQHLDADVRDLRLITCHLGSGASVCAVELGRSIDTTMGMTPLEGLVMGTRSGDIDPGVLLLLQREGWSADRIETLLQQRSGLAGLSGLSGDLRDIEEAAAQGQDAARLALHVFAHRVRKAVGAYAAVMGGVDGIVFTAGIGENSSLIRHRIAQRMDWLGARLDEDRNRDARVSPAGPVAEISTPHSRVRLLVVATDEAMAIAEDTARMVAGLHEVRTHLPIPIAVSARHVHLSQAHVEALFGPGHQLTPRNPLSQPGQFACEECVDVIGPKRTIERVRVLGPARSETQVEVSRTDEFALGVDAPVRASGDIDNTPGITLRGPAGRVALAKGVICAWRHIHMAPEDAARFGVEDRDVVEVAVEGGPRDLVFGDVLVRVSKDFRLEMHIDTDEANAARLGQGSRGVLVSTQGSGMLRRRRTQHDAVPAA